MKVISLFSGIGGLDLGFILTGSYEIIKAVELNKNIANIYQNNLIPVECADLTTYDFSSLPKADIIIGGPPCQGFSIAGKMDPNDERSKLIFTFLDAVESVQPKMFVMENVSNLYKSKKFESIRKKISSRIESLGYNFCIWQLNAKNYGVAQSRERIFYIGYQGKCPKIPKEEPLISSGQVLRSLPIIKDERWDCNSRIVLLKRPILRKSPFAGMLFNGRGRPIDLNRECNTLPASMGGNRTPIVDEKWLKEEEEYIPWVIRYHKHLKKGGKPNWEVPLHLRRITVLEAAVLQGFPMDFEFCDKNSINYKGIGNSVPPPLAKAIAKSIAKCL